MSRSTYRKKKIGVGDDCAEKQVGHSIESLLVFTVVYVEGLDMALPPWE